MRAGGSWRVGLWVVGLEVCGVAGLLAGSVAVEGCARAITGGVGGLFGGAHACGGIGVL